jgi:hypothetical protein
MDVSHTGSVGMEILRFVRCESFPEEVQMFGCMRAPQVILRARRFFGSG